MRKQLAHKQTPQTIDPPSFFGTERIVLQKKHRCENCNKLLGIEHVQLPLLDVKCPRCGKVNQILKDYERQVIITDREGKILYVNEQVERATGYSAKEVLGKSPAIWGNQMTKGFYKAMWNQIMNKKKAVVVQVTNKHKNGTLYPVILRISPILDVNGDVELFIGMETVVLES